MKKLRRALPKVEIADIIALQRIWQIVNNANAATIVISALSVEGTKKKYPNPQKSLDRVVAGMRRELAIASVGIEKLEKKLQKVWDGQG